MTEEEIEESKNRPPDVLVFDMRKINARIERLKSEGFSESEANKLAGEELMKQVQAP